ncbi:hypothetical protein LDENG_00104110 [Lucifuga dentata]|nr:hypothetical protein LDENG_00104110 [Lucifuga dentata]
MTIPAILHFLKGPYHPFCMFESNILIFIHVTLLIIISERIKPYFSFPDILENLLIFQNQIFKRKSLNLSKSNIQAIHPP